ncbi:MAG: cell division protein ZapA [Spirochaetes bacterium]|jgi:cell division protein ZapA (FtsZ GTPase activity inhibitor)|nr:cell division protein ZapA [Spirochaetota bacterium]
MRIELLGTSFTIHTDEDPKRLRDIVDYYRTKVQEIQGSVSTSDPLKIAILAGLLSVDEVFKTRDSTVAEAAPADEGGEADQIEAIADNLIHTLDSSLEE